jgi:hypothetical protein
MYNLYIRRKPLKHLMMLLLLMKAFFFSSSVKQFCLIVLLVSTKVLKYHTIQLDIMRGHDTFNNISTISWRSVLLVEETGVPGENHRPATRH